MDQLTKVNGQTLIYDAIGNLFKDGANTYYWQKGSQLKEIAGAVNAEYTYDYTGLRKSKTVGTTTTEFIWAGGLLMAQIGGGNTIAWHYDQGGSMLGFTWNGTPYFYMRELQNDVIGIHDSAGNVVVNYFYDAWGNLESITGTLATTLGTLNPIRYKGYYYDTESNLYYLQSRYYDPELHRFISPDVYFDTQDGIMGTNMYAYCQNNPVMFLDQNGNAIGTATIIVMAVGALGLGTAGGFGGNAIAKKRGAEGWEKVGWIAGGSVLGIGAGGTIGYFAAPTILPLLGVGGTAAAANAPQIAEKVAVVGEKASTALQTYYPPNNGFSGATQQIVLEAGTLLQRTGHMYGQFVAPAGTPTYMLSLPYEQIGNATTFLQLDQPLYVIGGTAAPWFDQIGGGVQYLLLNNVNFYLNSGYLHILP